MKSKLTIIICSIVGVLAIAGVILFLVLGNNKVTISFLGTGFLRYQVRNMIGVLLEIGEGKRKSEDVIEILAAKDRRKAGKTASPVGLYLKDVLY